MIVNRLFGERRSNDKSKVEEPVHPNGNGFNFLMDLFGLKNSKRQVRIDNADIYDDIYSCVNIVSDDIAKLPIKVYRKEDDKIKRIGKKEHQVAKLLSGRPNQYMNISDYIKLMMVDVLFSGNHYTLMRFDKDGKVEELLPLSSTTKPVIDINHKLWYQATVFGSTRYFHPWEIIHVKGFTRDGITGRSPIQVIAERVKANELANDFNTNLLEQGGTPSGLLKVPGILKEEARAKTKEEWKRVNGTDAIAVLDSGLEYQQMGLTQQDMQFIDSQKYNTQKITAIYKVPLHKINEMGRATYSNIEHQALEYVKNTLQPWITKIEVEFNTKIFTIEEQEEEYYIKFNLDSELRGDSKTRAEVHKLQVESGAKTLDDVRGENENSPYDEEWSRIPYITLNWTSADNLVRYQNAKAGVDRLLEKMKEDGNEDDN